MAPPSEADAEPVEASPLWPLLTVLAEIAERVARRQAEEHRDGNDECPPTDDSA
jgi:hypothetical protein